MTTPPTHNLGKPCGKCGATERNFRGECFPCVRERRNAWKRANPEKVRSWRGYRPDPDAVLTASGARKDEVDRFWSRVVPARSGCWLWNGCHARGYSKFYCYRAVQVGAHRFAYELIRGRVPEGLNLDHLCRNRGCVNPWHLEAVTQSENTMRAMWFRRKVAA